MENIRNLEVGMLQETPIIVPPDSSISKLVGVFRDIDVYEVFTMVGEKVGMVTVRDVLNASNITTTKVSSLVTPVPKLSPKSRIGGVAKIMTQYRVRALPILENEEVVGIITAQRIINFMKNMERSFSVFKAKDIMTENPVTMYEDEQAAKARNLMVKRRIDHLPVMSSSKNLSGMLTSTLLVFNMVPVEAIETGARGLEGLRRLNFPIKELMSSNISTCNLNDKIPTIISRMMNQKLTYSVVMLWEELQGIITYRDLMKLVAEPMEEGDVPVYIVGLPEDPFEAEVAKRKFIRTVNLLKKSFPYIEEARSIIKTSTSVTGKMRRRYEVDVSIKTPRKLYKFFEAGWELPRIYDIISNRLKRLMSQKPSKRLKDTPYRETGLEQ